MTDGDNPAVAEAGRIAFDDIERELLEHAETIANKPGPVNETWTPDMPSESKINDKGSFERFRRSAK